MIKPVQVKRMAKKKIRKSRGREKQFTGKHKLIPCHYDLPESMKIEIDKQANEQNITGVNYVRQAIQHSFECKGIVIEIPKPKVDERGFPHPNELHYIMSVISEVKQTINEKIKPSFIDEAALSLARTMYPYQSITKSKITSFIDKYTEHYANSNYTKMEFYLGLFNDELAKEDMKSCLKHDPVARESYRKICMVFRYKYDL